MQGSPQLNHKAGALAEIWRGEWHFLFEWDPTARNSLLAEREAGFAQREWGERGLRRQLLFRFFLFLIMNIDYFILR